MRFYSPIIKVRPACKHLVGNAHLRKRQHLADVRPDLAGIEQFDNPGQASRCLRNDRCLITLHKMRHTA
jgi:hypothetical protein